jgi:hypothetical protein
MDLLTTYTHQLELQVITVLLLISTLYKSLAHAKSSQSTLDISWQWLQIVESLQLPVLRSSCHSHPCRTQPNSLNYSAISSQPPMQSSAELNCPSYFLYNSLARTTSKTLFFCCMRVSLCGNVFTKPSLRNGHLFIRLLHSNGCIHCLF